MLTTEQVHFGSTPQHKVVLSGKVGAPHGNFGVGVRVFKSLAYNDGDVPVVITVDGSAVDAGYGLAWTTRGTVTIPAKSHAVLQAAIRGTEEHWRIAVLSSTGDSEGRIEIFDQSSNFIR